MRAMLAALALAALPTLATADYDAGMAAYNKGDYATALTEFRALADKGVVLAYTHLGYMHSLGEGVEADLAEAARWFERAARAGNATSQMVLGVMYFNGEGVERSPVQAFAWLGLAGAAGIDEALAYLELVRERLTPEEHDQAQKLARALFREHGDRDLRKLVENGWLAAPKAQTTQ